MRRFVTAVLGGGVVAAAVGCSGGQPEQTQIPAQPLPPMTKNEMRAPAGKGPVQSEKGSKAGDVSLDPTIR